MTSRSWCFTINSFTELDCGQVMEMALDSVYTIVGNEKGSKKQRDHLQGYVYFRSAKSLMRMKKYLPRAHLEIAKGSPQENEIYCSKDGDVWRHGQLPTQGLVSKEKLDDIMKNPYENFHLYNQYRRTYQELQRSQVKTHKRELRLLSSKDRFDFAKKCDSTVLFMDKFDHYNDEQVVFMDYFEAVNDNIIRWINGYPPTIKRGYEIIKFDPEMIVLIYSTPYEHSVLSKNYNKYLD